MLTTSKQVYQNPATAQDFAWHYLNRRLLANPCSTEIRSCIKSGKVYAETSNRLTYAARALASFFPRSKFIHLHRHPAEVIRSGMRRGYYDGHFWDKYRIEPSSDDPYASQWSGWSPFNKCCWYWQAVCNCAFHAESTISQERWFTLASSDLYSGNMNSINALTDWLEIPRLDNEEVSEVVATRHNQQRRGEFPKFEDWDDAMVETMWDIVSPAAKRLGYLPTDVCSPIT
jgi:hypothetical protein